jgi:hypothetical protein
MGRRAPSHVTLSVRRSAFRSPAARRIVRKNSQLIDFKMSDGRPSGCRRTCPGDTRTLSLDPANRLPRLIPMGIQRRAWGLPNRCSAPCPRRSRTATPAPALRGRGWPGHPPRAYTSSGGKNTQEPKTPIQTLEIYSPVQIPRILWSPHNRTPAQPLLPFPRLTASPWPSRNNALRITSTGVPCCKASDATTALSRATVSACELTLPFVRKTSASPRVSVLRLHRDDDTRLPWP